MPSVSTLMILRTTILTLALLSSCLAQAIPDTVPGRLLKGWLDAINSGDRAQILAFAEKYQPARVNMVDNLVRFARTTGGFDVVRVTESTPQGLKALVKERGGEDVAELDMKVQGEGDAATVAGMRLQVVPPPPDLAPKRLSQDQAIASFDKYIAGRAKRGESGAALIARNGKVLYEKAWGLADRERNVPATPDTKFRIGSMNKMFTSVAALQLVEQGKIALDKPIGIYLKQYPNADVAVKVTVRHLLTHTGGTGDIFGPEFEKNRLQLRTIGDYVKLYGPRGLQFEPGKEWRYSNYGFLLLGAIIEAVSGQSYYDYVREHVFRPAGMTHTDSLSEDEKVEGRAVGYMMRETWTPNTDTLPWRGTSAGGGYSTVRDLRKFAEALLAGKLLKKETLAEATKEQRQGYGFGFGIDSNPVRWGHGGGAPGMNGDLRVYPESGWIVVTLANLDPPAASRAADYFTRRMPL